MSKKKIDFGGWATRVNLKCTDGRTILKDAFIGDDKKVVPLVWQHQHNSPDNVLGHALLENRDDGVYAYCAFNDTPNGQDAKVLVEHKDIQYLSIYANQLVEKSKKVAHGVIREVSLVMAGANPGALIDFLAFEHADGSIENSEDEAIIYTGLLIHTDGEEDEEEDEEDEEVVEHADGKEETIQDVFNTLSEKQKTAVYAVIGAVLENDSSVQQSDEDDNILEGEEKLMKKNVFDGMGNGDEKGGRRRTLTHAEFDAIVADAKKTGSFKQAFLMHAGTYGIDNIDYLFPDAQTLTNEPTLYSRDMRWVASVFGGARHVPFSRIKSIQADITADEARALGYTTGNLKVEEVFGLLKRETTPTTVYKKQKLDRDDIIDITDLDVVAWLKREMRMMLDEELSRAILVSDSRSDVSDDKISETNIRPIWKDDDFYAHHVQLASTVTAYEDLIDEMLLARINYKGSGSPTLFCTEAFLVNMLLVKDTTGRRIYPTKAELMSALMVSDIQTVPVMEGLHRTDTVEYDLLAIIVNMRDYAVGADKGGQVSMFDDFDIDYNQYKYLIETRCSGALTLPKSALVIERAQV